MYILIGFGNQLWELHFTAYLAFCLVHFSVSLCTLTALLFSSSLHSTSFRLPSTTKAYTISNLDHGIISMARHPFSIQSVTRCNAEWLWFGTVNFVYLVMIVPTLASRAATGMTNLGSIAALLLFTATEVRHKCKQCISVGLKSMAWGPFATHRRIFFGHLLDIQV